MAPSVEIHGAANPLEGVPGRASERFENKFRKQDRAHMRQPWVVAIDLCLPAIE